MKGPLVVVVGPTGVGKTATAIAVAQAINGEIVSADSRQIFTGMVVGTARPSPEELAAVPHHLVGILPPDAPFGLAEYQSAAYAAIDDILSRGRLPLLVGGTGQYVKAVVEGWGIPRVPPNPALRLTLEAFAGVFGPLALHARLAALDPVAAQRLDYRNVRRVVRALEVCLQSGQPVSQQQRKQPPGYRVLWLGLIRPREALYARIDSRIDRMLAAGWVDEVQRLIENGYSSQLPGMSALGYREIGQVIAGDASLDEAKARIRRESRRFVRQQATWFRAGDPRIRWFDLEVTPTREIIAYVSAWVANE